MTELSKERLYDAILDNLSKDNPDSSTANVHELVDTVEVSADIFDNHQLGIEVIGTNGKMFTIIIIDESEG